MLKNDAPAVHQLLHLNTNHQQMHAMRSTQFPCLNLKLSNLDHLRSVVLRRRIGAETGYTAAPILKQSSAKVLVHGNNSAIWMAAHLGVPVIKNGVVLQQL